MCNDCNCDDYELCSIVGMQPIGFCCSKCEHYDEMLTCLKAKMGWTLKNKPVLPSAFCVKTKAKKLLDYPEIQH
ncbi:MAG: hypothetical protein JW891_05630 [Candidatus Lokiarchaeota archaeon]|nr:hypothetical protein [Candidatus Lokiarchaeota archaeon]